MNNSDLQDNRQLFGRIAEGDGAAFTTVFHLYYDQLCRNAKRILKSEYGAEEVVQEAFLQLWNNRNTLSALDAPVSYLFRITANRCFDRIRKQELDIRTQYNIRIASSTDASTEQEHGLDLAIIKKLLQEAIDLLPPQQKAVYQLQQQEELSYQEIADRLSLSRNTVRNHMARAIESIRAYLLRHGQEFLVFFLFLKIF